MANNGETGSTRKRDRAPRGVIRYGAKGWGIRFTCSRGHVHQEFVSRLLDDAKAAHAERRSQRRADPAWCPVEQRRQAQAAQEAEAARAAGRLTVERFVLDQYLPWARRQPRARAWRSIESESAWVVERWGSRLLDTLTRDDAEAFLSALEAGVSPSGAKLAPASVNRYRARLSHLFGYALAKGVVLTNPVRGQRSLTRPTARGRLAYLLPVDQDPAEERALLDACKPEHRAAVVVALHTGLRWSEQRSLRWADVDMLAATATIPLSKSGFPRTVPLNSTARAVFVDLGSARRLDARSDSLVFGHMPTDGHFFRRVVVKARELLRAQGKDAGRLDGFVWHSLRHTFVSRLVMAGVDPRTVQELAGWRSLAMFQRYAHLSHGHLTAAVERLVSAPPAVSGQRRG